MPEERRIQVEGDATISWVTFGQTLSVGDDFRQAGVH